LRPDCRKRGSKRYKGTATTISLWTKQPRVRPKATSTRRIQQQNNNKVRGQDTYLYALSGPTLSKANGHPPYKDKHDKEKDTYLYALSGPTLSKANGHLPYKDKHDNEDNTCLIDLDKYTQSKAKPSRQNYKTRNNCKVQGQDTYLIALDEHTQSKAESSRKNKVQSHVQTPGKLTSQDMKKILDHTRIKGHHPDTSSGDTQRAR